MAQGRRLQSCKQGGHLHTLQLSRPLSEIQRGQVPKVTVKEISDALSLLETEVVVEGLVGWGKADELSGEEASQVFPSMFQK